MDYSHSLALAILALLVASPQDRSTSALGAANAVPREALPAVLDSFRTHRVVALGDAHGNRLGEAFQLALLRDPRFPTVVNDIVIEMGNSRYQDVVDRYVRGDDVPPDAVRRAWRDTLQQHIALLDIPEFVTAVRDVNRTLAPERRLRVWLGEPPLDWTEMRTAEQFTAWEAEAKNDRDRFAADLIQREVLARKRSALLLYGAGHFLRKVVSRSIVTLLEAEKVPVFTIWTSAASELSTLQPDVATWKSPSLTMIKGTPLGATSITEYLGPNAGAVPPEWVAPMEQQFDAVLYVGPLSAITFSRPPLWRCAEPAFPERIRRVRLRLPATGDRLQQQCLK